MLVWHHNQNRTKQWSMDSCGLKPSKVDVCGQAWTRRHKPLWPFKVSQLFLNQPLLFVFVQAELRSTLIFTTQSPKGRDAFFKTITSRVWILHPQKRRKETQCQIGRLMPKLEDDVINLTVSIRRTSSCDISILHHNQWQIQHFRNGRQPQFREETYCMIN